MPIAKRTIKNNGVNNLFMLLCEFLSGALTGGEDAVGIVQNVRNKLPRFLAIGAPLNVTPTNTTMQSLQDQTEMGLQERFPLSASGSWTVDTNGLIYTQYSCNIPHTSVGNAQIKEIGLFAGAGRGTRDMLARITLTSGTNAGIQIGDGQSLLVNWRLGFTNKITIIGENE